MTHKASLYKYTCGIVFENAKPYLTNALITMDKSGTETFRSQLATYLRGKMSVKGGPCLIKQVKMQESRGNNLLQLLDYVAGVLNRKVQSKKDVEDFYRYLSPKEMSLRVRPGR